MLCYENCWTGKNAASFEMKLRKSETHASASAIYEWIGKIKACLCAMREGGGVDCE